jgi:hypothetical protein
MATNTVDTSQIQDDRADLNFCELDSGTVETKDDRMRPDRSEAEHRKAMNHEALKDRRQEVANRASYTTKIFWLIVAWMVVVLLIVAAVGFRHPEQTLDVTGTVIPTTTADWFVAFHLSDSVLITLISGTTANVLGLFLVVAQHLFPRRRRESE